MVANTSIDRGRLISPFGTEYVGFKVTVGKMSDPSEVKRTYDDIDAMVRKHPDGLFFKEERDNNGRFVALHGSTEPFE